VKKKKSGSMAMAGPIISASDVSRADQVGLSPRDRLSFYAKDNQRPSRGTRSAAQAAVAKGQYVFASLSATLKRLDVALALHQCSISGMRH